MTKITDATLPQKLWDIASSLPNVADCDQPEFQLRGIALELAKQLGQRWDGKKFVPSGVTPTRGPLTKDEVDALVYRCRQAGDDSTYALVRAVEATHGVMASQAPNPYAGQGSIAEAWQRGYEGRPMLAHPGSDYARAYAEGKAARKADDTSGVKGLQE